VAFLKSGRRTQLPRRAGPSGPAGHPAVTAGQGSFLEILIPVKTWCTTAAATGIRLLIIPYALLPLSFSRCFQVYVAELARAGRQPLIRGALWLRTFWYLIRPPV